MKGSIAAGRGRCTTVVRALWAAAVARVQAYPSSSSALWRSAVVRHVQLSAARIERAAPRRVAPRPSRCTAWRVPCAHHRRRAACHVRRRASKGAEDRALGHASPWSRRLQVQGPEQAAAAQQGGRRANGGLPACRLVSLLTPRAACLFLRRAIKARQRWPAGALMFARRRDTACSHER